MLQTHLSPHIPQLFHEKDSGAALVAREIDGAEIIEYWCLFEEVLHFNFDGNIGAAVDIGRMWSPLTEDYEG